MAEEVGLMFETDIVSMLMLAGILIVLFSAAAGLSMHFDRRRAKRTAAELGSLA